MPRKKRASTAEDIMEIVAYFPWWVGVILAVVSYTVLHAYASAPAPIGPATAGQMGDVMAASMGHTLAGIGQYLLPFLCVVGAAVSAIRRHQRAALLSGVAAGNGASALNAMSWPEFELMIGQWFRGQGYAVSERGGDGADGGIDLALTKGGETFFVQCKQWRATKVGVAVVRELYGVMAAHGATGGFVITSGSFTEDATRFAEGRNVQLLDGEALARMIQRRAPESLSADRINPKSPSHLQRELPHCPMCGAQMVQRTAKRGATIGQRFWGCSTYPACKGTVQG